MKLTLCRSTLNHSEHCIMCGLRIICTALRGQSMGVVGSSQVVHCLMHSATWVVEWWS